MSYTGQPDIPDTVAETALSEIIVEVEESLEVEKKVEEEVEQFSKVEKKEEKVETFPEVEMKTINTTVVKVEVEEKIIVGSEEKMEEISLHSEFEDDLDEESAPREETSLRPESQQFN